MASVYVRSGNLLQATNLERNETEQVYQITDEKQMSRETAPGTRSDLRSRTTSRDVKPLFLLLRTNIYIIYAILCVCPCVKGLREQRFAIEPQDQVAVVGSRVTLPCRVENKFGQLQWTKDDFGLGTHRHLVGYDRYKMIGSDEEGDYSLDIREVTLDDDGLYQCQVSSGPRGQPAIRSRYARLSVLVPPEPPKIVQGSFIEVVEDSEQEFECISVGGKPPAEITWVDGEGGVLSQNVVNTVQPMSDGRRFTARSILRLRTRRYHDGQNLICQAQNTADRAYKSSTIKLEVKYAPTVRLFLKSNIAAGRIFEGDKLRLGCEAEGNPSDFTYKWYLNNEMIPGNFSNELIITNLTRKYNDNTMKCEVHNSVGKSEDSKILEVSYGPEFIIKPRDVEAESGATATLSCSMDGNPLPETIWLHYKNGRKIKVGHSSNLTIDVNKHTAGEYRCKGRVVDFPPIEARATVFVKGPPKIVSNSTQYGLEGDTIHVDCLTLSVPRPSRFQWSFEGRELKPHDQDYELLEETLSDGLTKSTLLIREGRSVHFGAYNCTVYNSYGSDTFKIFLDPYKPLSSLLVASSVTACLLGVMSLSVAVVLCRRRPPCPSTPDSVDDVVKKPDVTDVGLGDECVGGRGSDRGSDVSDLKLDIRRVEGGHDTSSIESPKRTTCEYSIPAGLELPLAGLVPLPNVESDDKYMQYSRYSTDFSDPTNNLHFKVSNQMNGYVQYVDYSKDYLPPVLNSDFHGPLVVGINDQYPEIQNVHKAKASNSNQTISPLVVQTIGPDVIPFTSAELCGGVDLSYAATYGNPYLKNNDANTMYTNSIKADCSSAPPPYYSLRNSASHLAVASPMPQTGCLPRMRGSLVSSTNACAHPQVLKSSSQSSSALYILPPPNNFNQSNQITKCNGIQSTNATHV